MIERNIVMAAKQANDLLRLAQTQQAVVDKNAGQTLADRLMDQQRGDRGIDTAGEAAQNPSLPHLRANHGDRLGPERAHRPIAFKPRDLVNEIRDQPGAVWRMRHFEMKLDAVKAA